MTTITRDEWLKALEEAGVNALSDDQGALTVAEFAAMFGICRTAAVRRLEHLCAAGKATRTQKRVAKTYAVAYRLTP